MKDKIKKASKGAGIPGAISRASSGNLVMTSSRRLRVRLLGLLNHEVNEDILDLCK
jgi:hypothetical protein